MTARDGFDTIREALSALRSALICDEQWSDKLATATTEALAALAVLEAETSRLTEALDCPHNGARTGEEAEEFWEYVDHDGQLWSRCKECGLLELWADGTFFRALLASRGGRTGEKA